MTETINTISFPGLGINGLKINPVAFNIFGKDVMWYGIIITLGIIAGFCYALYRSKFEKIKQDDIYDLAIIVIILAIIGARTYFVFTKLDDYIAENIWDTLYNMVAIWNGGIAIYGAIIGGSLGVIIYAIIKKIRMLKIFDLVVPGVMLGQLIGRWGNFMNAEAFGSETSLPWRMGIVKQYSSGFSYDYGFVHPTFLYESLWNLLGFILINLFYKKKKYDGQIFIMYLTWYGFGRMIIEGLRTDSLYIGDIRISQLVGLLCFIVGTVLLIVFRKRCSIQPAYITEPAENAETDDAKSATDAAEDMTADKPDAKIKLDDEESHTESDKKD